jgi:hypothetical protein
MSSKRHAVGFTVSSCAACEGCYMPFLPVPKNGSSP